MIPPIMAASSNVEMSRLETGGATCSAQSADAAKTTKVSTTTRPSASQLSRFGTKGRREWSGDIDPADTIDSTSNIIRVRLTDLSPRGAIRIATEAITAGNVQMRGPLDVAQTS